MLRSRTQSGHLVQIGVGTFTSALHPRSELGDLTALTLDISDPVWVSGPSAAALHGFDGFVLRKPFHLTLPRDRNVQRSGHMIHTSNDLPLLDQTTVKGLATLSVTRTLIDLARTESSSRLTAALDSALRDGGTSETFLHRRITDLRSRGRYGIPKLLAVIDGCETSRGGHSWLERRFLELVASSGLPLPETQVVLGRAGDRVIRVDCYFSDFDLVVELLGYRWHRTKHQMQRDSERMNELQLQGKRVMQFTYDDIAQRPDSVPDKLRLWMRI
jgi:hypothetical protein